jgi:hypothetical protein
VTDIDFISFHQFKTSQDLSLSVEKNFILMTMADGLTRKENGLIGMQKI